MNKFIRSLMVMGFALALGSGCSSNSNEPEQQICTLDIDFENPSEHIPYMKATVNGVDMPAFLGRGIASYSTLRPDKRRITLSGSLSNDSLNYSFTFMGFVPELGRHEIEIFDLDNRSLENTLNMSVIARETSFSARSTYQIDKSIGPAYIQFDEINEADCVISGRFEASLTQSDLFNTGGGVDIDTIRITNGEFTALGLEIEPIILPR